MLAKYDSTIGLQSRSAVEVYKENWVDVVYSSCRHNRKCGNFMLLFCRGQHGLVRKCVLHVQHAYFFAFN